MKALDLAYYIKKEANEKQIYLSKKKLQKLLYYIQGYFLKEFRKPAFNEDIEHWEDGPVVREVYKVQTYENDFFNSNKTISIPKSLINIVENVLNSTKNLNTNEIIEKTHSEDPWKNHKNYNEIIPKEDILKYFDQNDPLDLLNNSEKTLSEDEKHKMYLDIFQKRSNLYKELARV